MLKTYERNPLEDALIWDEQVAKLYEAIAQLTPDSTAEDPHADGESVDP